MIDQSALVSERGQAKVARSSPAQTSARLDLRLVALCLLFFLSGVPALVYQTAWQRILALYSGVGIYSIAMIVSAFLGGLGLGSYLGGRLSIRLSAHGAVLVFALLELSIGLFALGSTSTFQFLYGRITGVAHPLAEGVAHFVALALPTTLMGMTLPVLVRGAVREVATAGRTVSYLYGVNTLGAAAGAILTPWFFIRFRGIDGAIHIAAACNVIVAVGALCASVRGTRSWSARIEGQSSGSIELPIQTNLRRPFALCVLLYGLSGFCALGLEIIWFRLCDVAAKSTAFTFGTVLAIYLAGLGVGSLLGARWSKRLRQPFRTFLWCQCASLLYATGVVAVLTFVPGDVPGIAWLLRYWGGYDGVAPGSSSVTSLVILYGVVPSVLFAVPTLLMGVAFTCLQRVVQDETSTSGFKVGILQAANIGGCVVGTLVVGLVLLNQWGTTGALRVLVLAGLVFVIAGLVYESRAQFVLAGIGLAVLAAIVPSQDRLWMRLHGMAGKIPWTMFDEDATGVVAIAPDESGKLTLYVDGKGHSWFPFGSIHSLLGAVPAVVHPAPRDIAIIGLGSGDTAWAAACRRETQRVQVFELCAPEIRLLRRLAESRLNLPDLRRLLNDPRVEVLVADGRNALVRNAAQFDLIEADASRPNSAYAGNLYSLEFFELCARRLKPGGIMCTWSPTPRVYRTFRSAFPYSLDFNNGEYLIGSTDPLPIELDEWESRIRDSHTASYLGWSLQQAVLEHLRTARPTTNHGGHLDSNRDLFPRDEFLSPP